MTLTGRQVEFAESMTNRRWTVLEALSNFWSYLSASERADLEPYALMRNGLASCHASVPGRSLRSSSARSVGRAILNQRTRKTRADLNRALSRRPVLMACEPRKRKRVLPRPGSPRGHRSPGFPQFVRSKFRVDQVDDCRNG